MSFDPPKFVSRLQAMLTRMNRYFTMDDTIRSINIDTGVTLLFDSSPAKSLCAAVQRTRSCVKHAWQTTHTLSDQWEEE